MSPQCPQTVDPERLADQESSCEGTLPLALFQRLTPLLLQTAGEVQFHFHFARDLQSRLLLQVEVQAPLILQCQRCAEPLALQVNSRQELVVVQGFEEAEALADHLEPVFCTAGLLDLHELIEEELLLALPAVPRHERCEPLHLQSGPALESESKSPNPFGILATLKKE